MKLPRTTRDLLFLDLICIRSQSQSTCNCFCFITAFARAFSNLFFLSLRKDFFKVLLSLWSQPDLDLDQSLTSDSDLLRRRTLSFYLRSFIESELPDYLFGLRFEVIHGKSDFFVSYHPPGLVSTLFVNHTAFHRTNHSVYLLKALAFKSRSCSQSFAVRCDHLSKYGSTIFLLYRMT